MLTGEGERRLTVAPAPNWAKSVSLTDVIPNTDVNGWNGVIRILSDTQIHISSGEIQQYFRRVQRVLSRVGAEQAAHFATEFDAHFETIQVHSLKILRDGEEIEHADANSIELIRRERNFERLIFDGRLTASSLIPDVREGDIIDVSFSLLNSNPILRRKWSSWFDFDPFYPWAITRFRLLSPQTATILLRSYNAPPQPVQSPCGDHKEWVWTYSAETRTEPEDLCSPWQIQHPSVQLSEFQSWNEVTALLSGYYQDTVVPDEIKREIRRITDLCKTPGEQAIAWLRFVQRNLRYSAAAMINGGVIPRPLDAILASRFGDCKDATRFYLAGARELGLDVCASLVSTTFGPGLGDILPSLSAFNHCIVRLRLEGISYWLDPTIPNQGGTLSSAYQPSTGWALPLSSETCGLERIADRSPPHYLHTDDKLEVGPTLQSPAIWTRDIEFNSWGADEVRSVALGSGPAALSRFMLEDARRHWPGISEVKPLQIDDDPDENSVRITAFYDVHDLWIRNGEKGEIALKVPDFRFLEELAPLRITQDRRSDIFLGRPRRLTRRLEIVLPKDWHWSNFQLSKSLSSLSYSVRAVMEGRRSLIISRELSIDSASLAAAECSDYHQIVDMIGRNVITIAAKERRAAIKPLKSSLWWLLPTKSYAILISLVLLAVIRGATSFLLQQPSNSPPNETPNSSVSAGQISYQREVWQRISATRVYPERVGGDCTIRTAFVQFELDDSGAVTSALVQQSSGDLSIDQAAIDTIYRAQAYPRRPQGIERTSMIIPLVFNPLRGLPCSK